MPDPLTAERLAEIHDRASRTQALAPLDRAPVGEWPQMVLEVVAELERLRGELATLEGYVDHHVQQEAKLHSRVLQLERELAAAHEALQSSADALQWIAEHHPKAMREMPTPLFHALIARRPKD